MKKLLNVFLIAVGAAMMTGCATGPKFSQVKASIPSIAQDNGRIYFYRISSLGAAVQPDVHLNGGVVGTAAPGGFFYVDRAAGNYKVVTATEVERTLSLTLDKGQTRYVRLDVSMGFFVGHIYPELVGNSVGEKEITNCHYTGTDKLASK